MEERIKEIRKTIRKMKKAYEKNHQDWILPTIEGLEASIEAIKKQDPEDWKDV